MDLLRQPRSLGLLRLDDPHLDVARGRRAADVGQQRRVAALEEQPRPLERALGELQLGQLGLVVAQIGGEGLDVAAEGPPAGVVGAGLGRVGRAIDRGRAGRPCAVGRRAIDEVELVAQLLPAPEQFGVGLPVPLAHALQRVRAVADRRLRLRVESVEAAVPYVGPGACWLHRTVSIGVAFHGQTTSMARVLGALRWVRTVGAP